MLLCQSTRDKMKKKTCSICCFTLIVVSLFASTETTGCSITFQNNLSTIGTINAEKPDITIQTDSKGFIEGINATSQEVIESSRNASSLINNLIINMTGGSVLFARAGTYVVPTLHISQANITIYGEGNATDFVLAPNTNGPVFYVTSPLFTIENIQIDGNAANQAASHASGIQVLGGNCANILNCYIHNCIDAGISIQSASNCKIENNIINATVGPNIFVGGHLQFDSNPADFNTVINNNCGFGGLRGRDNNIHIRDANYCIVDDNYCANASDTNIELQAFSTNITSDTLCGNSAINATEQNFLIDGWTTNNTYVCNCTLTDFYAQNGYTSGGINICNGVVDSVFSSGTVKGGEHGISQSNAGFSEDNMANMFDSFFNVEIDSPRSYGVYDYGTAFNMSYRNVQVFDAYDCGFFSVNSYNVTFSSCRAYSCASNPEGKRAGFYLGRFGDQGVILSSCLAVNSNVGFYIRSNQVVSPSCTASFCSYGFIIQYSKVQILDCSTPNCTNAEYWVRT